jgi:hypothetical protein
MDSGSFIADEYEQAVLNRSWLRVFVGILMVGAMGLAFVVLMTLAFAGERIISLFN